MTAGTSRGVDSPLSCAGPADTVGHWQKIPSRFKQEALVELVVTIYKICSASAWREAERSGVYRGSARQVEGTARKFFFGQRGLFLVEVDADALGDALRWEPSRNDELFPHLYGELDLGAVRGVYDLPARSDGYHDIPELKP